MAPRRILLNFLVDLALAAAALPLALWLDAPGDWPPALWWPPALIGGLGAFLLGAVPLRLARQYWRFSGLPDMLAVLAAAVTMAALFSLGLFVAGPVRGWGPPSIAFPFLHAGSLVALLGAARMAVRMRHTHYRGARALSSGEAPARTVMLAGAGDAADLFLRALSAQRVPGFRVLGILAPRARQAGRRILGVPILGALDDADEVLERLREQNRLPATLVLVGSDVSGKELEALLDAADRHGVTVRRAPRPTALDPTAPERQRPDCLLYTSPSPRDQRGSRMPSSA